MTVLILDNYDSFTYNLYQYVGEVTGGTPEVRRNDEITLHEIEALAPAHIIISPGPGRPDIQRDFGVCAEVIDALGDKTPILGVCLGHQGIIHRFGGRVIRAPQAVHGKVALVTHSGAGIFEGLPEPLETMRYHSLIGERSSLPACLEVTAELHDDRAIIMGVQHRSRPIYGVQFHPESVGTPLGQQLLRNFFRCTAR